MKTENILVIGGTGKTGRRKFENLLIITRPRERLKIFYQT